MYQFEDLKRHIEKNLGIDTSKSKGRFKPIREIFKTSSELNKRVDPGPEGFYYTDDKENKHKGFLFIEGGWNKQFAIRRGLNTIIPKFHISNCSTIEWQKKRENFNGHYVFSQKIEKVEDLDGIEKEITLCKNCLNMQSQIMQVLSVSEYVEKFINNDETEGNFLDDDLPNTRRDYFQDNGYTEDWDQKSHAYRINTRFTCQDCGIRLNENYIDGYYLETHHIDGNKQNDSTTNLKALCVLCHANVDHNHKRNYSLGRNKQKLETFIYIFRDKLLEVKNKYFHEHT